MNNKRPRLFLFGTPDLAVAPFETLRNSGLYEICGVITQPDKPAGRGQELTPPPVKIWAHTHGIPVFQPLSLKGLELQSSTNKRLITHTSGDNPDWVEAFNNGPIDAGIAVAYGKIIPKALIELPRVGIINIHLSLLPRWRGAAPIHRAIFAGDKESGVTLMAIDQGLDTGPIYCLEKEPITESDNTGTLTTKLSTLGAKFLLEKLPSILSGTLQAEPQPTAGVTYAEKWLTEENSIDWEEEADALVRRIRACSPTPGARSSFEGGFIKIFAAHPVAPELISDLSQAGRTPGSIVSLTTKELVVAAGNNSYISIDELQLPGKKRLKTAELLKGAKFSVGMMFGNRSR